MKSIMLSLFICLTINLLYGQISLDQPLPPPPPPPPPSPPSEQVEIDVSHENIKLEEDKHILIPYNNHGEWGYCDTLGNQLISSQFQEASFFRYKIKEKGITQECARVQTSYGTNYIRLNGSWVFPEQLDVYRSLHISDLPDNKYWIVGEAGKLGIYNLVSNKWQVTPQFDTLGLYDMKLFGRNLGEEVLTLIDIETGKKSETNFIKLEFRYVTDSNSPYTVNRCILTTREGEYCYFAKDEVYYLSKDQYKASRDGLSVLSPSKSSRVPKNSGGNLSEAVTQGDNNYRIVDFQDFTRYGAFLRYGFQQLYIVINSANKYGVVNEKNNVILPFEYDEIVFNASGTEAAIRKGDFWGRKLFFTTYGLIEPKYEKCYFYRTQTVSSSWSFNIYAVEKDGQKGYVGENGIEYFQF